jgi:hypothetical protein
VTSLFDQGFQLQGSVMLWRDVLQLYATGSKVFGQYGKSVGCVGGPETGTRFARREMHVNLQGIYLRRSPVGGSSYPYIVGGNGWLFNTDFIITF